jgi:HEAT repeat protein
MRMRTDGRDRRLSGKPLDAEPKPAQRQDQTLARDRLLQNQMVRVTSWMVCVAGLIGLCFPVTCILAETTLAQDNLTPRQRAIEKQRLRLSSSEVEERRDALSQLGLMQHRDAARVALTALNDPVAIVRATAASAVLALPAEEAVVALTPLLQDKDEFVRVEGAYALGKVRSRNAVPALTEALVDAKDGVRAAAAVSLGEIGDESAVVPLVQVVSGDPVSSVGGAKRKGKREQNQFVIRAAAVALGQIRSRTAVPALIRVLGQEELASDVKREAARSLGLIADLSAVPALRAALRSTDPYLSQAALEAIRRIAPRPG